MKSILIVFGTRPEAIKLAPLALEFKKYPQYFNTNICITAQHREMLDQVLKVFEIVPDYDLNLMKKDQTLFDVTASVLIQMGEIIKSAQPDYVIVQGDTTTTFATSLAAFYHQVKIGHVEAGLRTFDKYSPFPEEINRKLTTSMADCHFAATEKNRMNLRNEGILEENILITGNTVIDALLMVKNKLENDNKQFNSLNSIDLTKKIILITGHRRENFGAEFRNVCFALKKIADKNPDVELVYPVHFNPNVRKPVSEILSNVSNIKLIEPLEYEPFIYLMNRCHTIITDSGGIQEEAPALGKPVLVTRNTTERPEAVEAGCVKLVGTNTELIYNETEKLLKNHNHYKSMAMVKNPYGNGTASTKIVDYFIKSLEKN